MLLPTVPHLELFSYFYQMESSIENLQKGKSWKLVVLHPPPTLVFLSYLIKGILFFPSCGMQLSKNRVGRTFCLFQILSGCKVLGIIFKTLTANPKTISFLPSLFLISMGWWIYTPQVMTLMSLSLEVPSFSVYFLNTLYILCIYSHAPSSPQEVTWEEKINIWSQKLPSILKRWRGK